MTYAPPPSPVEADSPSPAGSFASSLAQPPHGSGAYIPPSPPVVVSVPDIPRTGRRVWLILSVLFVLLALALVGLVGYFLAFLGPGASLVGMFVALLPFALVLVVVRAIDRWEPEPRGLVALAVGWGAIAAVGIALIADLGITTLIGSDGSSGREFFSVVVQAPVVEEAAKVLGLLVIFFAARRAIDGPVDGIVYGALVGAGFAFTENIQYFAISYLDGGAEDLTATFFVRGILSPFAHAMFTSVAGFALGLAARRGIGVGSAVRALGLGLIGAVALHAFWNGSALLGDFFALYLTLQVPLFVVFAIGILALRREESRLTYARLTEYAGAGWFTPEEVEMLATASGRRGALRWARTLPSDRSAIMRGFIADATALAAARQRALSGRDPAAAADEQALLRRTTAVRAALLSV